MCSVCYSGYDYSINKQQHYTVSSLRKLAQEVAILTKVHGDTQFNFCWVTEQT